MSTLTPVGNEVAPEHKISRIFFHEGIHFNSEKNEITFSTEAQSSFTELVTELQKQFVEETEVTPVSSELSLTTAMQVVEVMQHEGKGKKAIRKIKEKIILALSRKKKGKKVNEARESIEKKIKKYASHPRIEISIEYCDDAGAKKPIEGLSMTVWPDRTAHAMLDGFNKFLGYQKLIQERHKKSLSSEG